METERSLPAKLVEPIELRFVKALELAKRGGQRALELQSGLTAVQKEHGFGDIVTEGDLRVQDIFYKGIKESFPNDIIRSEELTDEDLTKGPFSWVIDPIDSTLQYKNRGLDWSVTGGIHYEGQPMAGFLNLPARDVMYSAVYGRGAYRNDERISTGDFKDFSEGFFYFNFHYPENQQVVDEYIAPVFRAVAGRTGYIGVPICTSYGVCQIAEGRVSPAILNAFLTPYDIGGAALILEEAGGVHSKIDWTKKRLPFLGTANQKIYDQICEYLGSELLRKLGIDE